MIKYTLKQNTNKQTAAYGKWYARPIVEETMNLAQLAQHMEEHNSGFSEAMCVGVLKAMVKCIKEQLLAGKNVKIDDLAIFSCGIVNREGAATPEEFSAQNNIEGVRLRARATGTLSRANLNLAASLKRSGATAAGQGGADTHKRTVKALSSDESCGTVTGGGTYAEGSIITVKAEAEEGFRFTGWSDGNTDNPRTLTVTEDVTLTAQFDSMI